MKIFAATSLTTMLATLLAALGLTNASAIDVEQLRSDAAAVAAYAIAASSTSVVLPAPPRPVEPMLPFNFQSFAPPVIPATPEVAPTVSPVVTPTAPIRTPPPQSYPAKAQQVPATAPTGTVYYYMKPNRNCPNGVCPLPTNAARVGK